MNKLIIASIFLFLQTACNSQQSEIDMTKQYPCILEEVQKNKTESYGIEFRKQLSDTLAYWINNIDNSFMRRYKKIKYEVSENMLFNNDHTKGLGIIIKHRLAGELLDFVDFIIGERNKAGVWEFYYSGVGSMSFDQYGDSTQRLKSVSKEDMERSVLEQLVGDGYYKKDCKRNYRYFERQWFPDWIRKKHRSEFYKSD